MSEDKLHGFVRKHKSTFETERAPSRVWGRIETDLDKTQVKRSWSMKQMLLIVGAICTLFVVGLYVGSQILGNDQAGTMYANVEDREYLEMQHYYGSILEDRQESFVSQVNEKTILDELVELDEGFEELKSDFANSSANNKELMMHLMKENYELRIKILEMAMDKMRVDPSLTNSNYENIEY